MLKERELLNKQEIEITIERLCRQLIENHNDFEHTVIVGVQPTSPIRSKFDFDKAIGKFIKGKYNSMFSASNFETFFTWNIEKNKTTPNYNLNQRPRRQEIKKSILENGSFYIFDKKNFLKNKNRLFGKIGFYLMQKYRGFQIDNLEDVKFINAIFKTYIK